MAFNESDINRDRVGKFSEKLGSAPGISLAQSRDLHTVPLSVSWVERDVIPPRARKPRDVERTLDLEVNIPMVSADEAPVGISFETKHFLSGDYRVHDGKLYRQTEYTRENAHEVFDNYYRGPSSDKGSEAAVAADMDERAGNYLIIDDDIWAPADEPIYTVNTFGMGSNHGGTSLSIDSLSRYKTEDGSPVNDWVFPLDQREEAVAKALQVAEDRGDTQSYDHIKNAETAELSGAFKPGSTFVQAPRIDYTPLYKLPYGSSTAVVETAFADYKKQLLSIPGAVYDVEDGWGGTTKRVDYTKLTERQASDYKEYVKRVESLGDR